MSGALADAYAEVTGGLAPNQRPVIARLGIKALIAGSLGALIIDPNALTVGASGAIFGLMAAVVVIARGRGMEQIASQFGLFIVLNLVLTFSISGISPRRSWISLARRGPPSSSSTKVRCRSSKRPGLTIGNRSPRLTALPTS